MFFWLNDDADRAGFERDLDALVEGAGISAGYWGAPADTGDRDVIDDSYDYSITLFFDSLADHDAYQVSPEHVAFVENNMKTWKQVKVYDVTAAN